MTNCNSNYNPNCKPQEEVESLLTKIFFTLTHVHGKVQLKNNTDHSAVPVSVTEEFHS